MYSLGVPNKLINACYTKVNSGILQHLGNWDRSIERHFFAGLICENQNLRFWTLDRKNRTCSVWHHFRRRGHAASNRKQAPKILRTNKSDMFTIKQKTMHIYKTAVRKWAYDLFRSCTGCFKLSRMTKYGWIIWDSMVQVTWDSLKSTRSGERKNDIMKNQHGWRTHWLTH